MACYLIYRDGKFDSLAVEPPDNAAHILFINRMENGATSYSSSTKTVEAFLEHMHRESSSTWSAKPIPGEAINTVLQVLEEVM